MDEALTSKRRLLAATVLLAAAAVAQAQGLQDPTRPPAQLSAGPGTALPIASGPQLQSVLISREPGGRHVAVIDGEAVRLGEAFHGARVVRMAPGEVELLRGRERQVLKLNAPPTSADSAVGR